MKATLGLIILAFALVALVGCTPSDDATATPTSEAAQPSATSDSPGPVPVTSLDISVAAFEIGGEIPERHTCFGDNVSPALEWSGVPEGTESLLLLVYDLDADAQSGASIPPGFVHWVVYNIPTTVTGYAEDVAAGATLDDGAPQGSNDFTPFAAEGALFPGGALAKLVGYDGPCPEDEHRYIFALYALDTVLDVAPGGAMPEIFEAMAGHTVAQAEYMGVFAPPQ